MTSSYIALVDGEAGAYGVVVPDCPGAHAMGDTIEEALSNAGEALRDWTETRRAAGLAVPPPRPLEALRGDPEIRKALAEGATLAFVAPSRP